MILVYSSDRLVAVNAKKVQKFYIDTSKINGIIICADDIVLSCHKEVGKAKESLRKMLDCIWCDDPCMYFMEDTI